MVGKMSTLQLVNMEIFQFVLQHYIQNVIENTPFALVQDRVDLTAALLNLSEGKHSVGSNVRLAHAVSGIEELYQQFPQEVSVVLKPLITKQPVVQDQKSLLERDEKAFWAAKSFLGNNDMLDRYGACYLSTGLCLTEKFGHEMYLLDPWDKESKREPWVAQKQHLKNSHLRCMLPFENNCVGMVYDENNTCIYRVYDVTTGKIKQKDMKLDSDEIMLILDETRVLGVARNVHGRQQIVYLYELNKPKVMIPENLHIHSGKVEWAAQALSNGDIVLQDKKSTVAYVYTQGLKISLTIKGDFVKCLDNGDYLRLVRDQTQQGDMLTKRIEQLSCYGKNHEKKWVMPYRAHYHIASIDKLAVLVVTKTKLMILDSDTGNILKRMHRPENCTNAHLEALSKIWVKQNVQPLQINNNKPCLR